MGIVSSESHIGRRSGLESGPEDSIEEWVERLSWVVQEAESQIPWLDKVDARVAPPGGKSILDHWKDLNSLQSNRYIPLIKNILSSSEDQEVLSREHCIQLDGAETDNDSSTIPQAVANERTVLLNLLKNLSSSQWDWFRSESDLDEGRGLLGVLHEIATEDRRILREMSLQLLDRHREALTQRELRQKLPPQNPSL